MERHRAKWCPRNVYLGLALSKQKNYDESEACYREAITGEKADRQKKDRKENPAAWQGLVNIYEAQFKVNEYMDAALKLATIFQDLYAQVRASRKWEKR